MTQIFYNAQFSCYSIVIYVLVDSDKHKISYVLY